MKQKVCAYIERYGLLSMNGLHLVALSGGADSVALLRVLLLLGYKVEAMHCNFRLRGTESDRDEAFCKTLCEQLGVKLHIVHFDTRAYAELHHVSIEMAARDLRYGYFRQLLTDLEAESICVAHHKDDCAETLLMNIIRGTGIKGLTGIRPKNGPVVRPLLCVSRQDIEDYLTLLHQPYVTDSSNLVDDVTRNKVRLNIMPLLREINPSVVDALSDTAARVTETMPLLNNAVEEFEREHIVSADGYETLSLEALAASPSTEYLLFSLLTKRGFKPMVIEQIAEHLDAQSGTKWVSGNMVAVIDRGRLVIAEQVEPFADMKLPIECRYSLRNGSTLELTSFEKSADFCVSKEAYQIEVDADTVRFPLCLRRVRQGDRFVPFGMRGSKLVSDFLTDRKQNIIEKERQLCLTDAEGNIVWLVGLRVSNRNRITDSTKKVLRVHYI